MISAAEITKEEQETRFLVKAFETVQLRPKTKARTEQSAYSGPGYQLNLSGSQLLAGFISALSAFAVLLWAFLKLWLTDY